MTTSAPGSSLGSPTCSGSASTRRRTASDLFSAWRLLFERLAEQSPCALVFEDLQRADSALLDFVEYLLEWSRNHPLFVVTLARPELAERRPDWGVGKRNFHAIYLDPLSDDSMEELLRGLVPGLPDELRARIREHADGVPLYAVETVRMLVDRGLVERIGDAYRPVGQVEALEVPDSLQSLLAARLDGLSRRNAGLLADAAVLGKTFTREALSPLSGLEADDLEPLLASLVRKEMLTVEADPWSPERGQYGFMQASCRRWRTTCSPGATGRLGTSRPHDTSRAGGGPTRRKSSRSSPRTISRRTAPIPAPRTLARSRRRHGDGSRTPASGRVFLGSCRGRAVLPRGGAELQTTTASVRTLLESAGDTARAAVRSRDRAGAAPEGLRRSTRTR